MKSNFDEMVDLSVKIKRDSNSNEEFNLVHMWMMHVDLRLHTLTWIIVYIAAILTTILVVSLIR